jgi:hypothetical protein
MKHIIGVVFCFFILLCLGLPIEHAYQTHFDHQSTTDLYQVNTNEVDVPIWNESNSWKYKIDNITILYRGMNNSTFSMVLHIDDLIIHVVNDTGPTYTVEIPPTNITAAITMDVNESTGYGPTNISLEITNCKVKGTIWVNKSDLGLKHLQVTIEGNSSIHIHEFPFTITFPLLGRTIPPLRVPFNKFNISVNLDFNPSFLFTKFPLNVSTTWGVPATNVTLRGTISSRMLNILNCKNRIIRFLHLIPCLARLLNMSSERLQQFSDTLFDILPVVNIDYVLNQYLHVPNTFEFPVIPSAFKCTKKENITIPAGTYESYNISALFGMGYLYYAPNAGSIIKMQGRFQDIVPFVSRMDMELIWTNYE